MPKRSSIQTVKPSSLLAGAQHRIQGIRSKPQDVKLVGETFRAVVEDRIIGDGIQLSRSMEGASTLTIPVDDPEAVLWRSKLLQAPFRLELDGLSFTFVAASPEDYETVLTLEATNANRLRQKVGPKKAIRGKWTRAEFFAARVAEFTAPRIPFYSPKLHVEQPIKTARQAKEDAPERDIRRGPGLDEKAPLTVKGVKATPAQIAFGDRALRIAASHKAPDMAMVALMMALIVENAVSNGSGGEGTSSGSLQVTSSTAANFGIDPRDVETVIGQFLTEGFTGKGGAIDHANQGIDPGVSAQLCQGSAYPDRYRQVGDEARAWVAAFKGGKIEAGGTGSLEVNEPFAFEVERGETYWDAGGRLAEEVRWRRFESASIIYFIAETTLLASRIRMRLSRESEGVSSIRAPYDSGKPVQEATVECRVKDWAAPPGSVCFLEDEGPATGRYLVSTIDSNISDTDANKDATIKLKRPTEPLPEPAPETTTKSVSFASASSKGGRGGGGLDGVTIGSTAPGEPAWGGAKAIFDQFIDPFMKSKGLAPGSRKRAANSGSGTSDHWVGATSAYATDYPTGSGESAARALAEAMGFSGWATGSWNNFTFECDGKRWAGQILWAAPDGSHFDHVHVGVHAA